MKSLVVRYSRILYNNFLARNDTFSHLTPRRIIPIINKCPKYKQKEFIDLVNELELMRLTMKCCNNSNLKSYKENKKKLFLTFDKIICFISMEILKRLK